MIIPGNLSGGCGMSINIILNANTLGKLLRVCKCGDAPNVLLD